MEKTEKKAYAMGLLARDFDIDFENLSGQESEQLNMIAEDAISDEPKTEAGKNLKKLVEEEQAKTDGEYNKGFNFHKDLHQNKIKPTAILIFKILADYAEKLVNKDEEEIVLLDQMLGDLIPKMNDMGFPVGSLGTPFNIVATWVSKLNKKLAGQLEHREEEIKALGVGVKSPQFGTLTPHSATLREMDEAIKKLRETFNFTEEDFRK